MDRKGRAMGERRDHPLPPIPGCATVTSFHK